MKSFFHSLCKHIQNGRWKLLTAAALLVAWCSAAPVQAAGLLMADGGFGGILKMEEHEVRVTINNGVAVTHVTQVFKNTENRQVEALYSFPIPKNASVSNFSMWINGKEMVGEVLEKERARKIYNTYKQQQRPKDPGLLEQVDYKTFEMRIFPINANASQKVQLTYYQELDVDHDQVTYVYPLATAPRNGMDTSITGRFAMQMEVKSAIAVAAIDSPSHTNDFVMVDNSDHYKMASLEQRGGDLARDIVVHYALKRPQSGIDLITSAASGQDGYFYLTLTVGQELAALDMGMDYVFLLDISGSMAHDGKLVISRRSLEAFIDALGAKDRFNVMTFNVQPNTVFSDLRKVDDRTREEAHAFLASQAARGGTILAPALTTAYQYGEPDRPLNVVILSDGMTEQQERQELVRLINQRPGHARVFCIGIGNEVNRPLLGQMAEASGGLAAFISNEDDFKRQAKAFRRKLMRPAMADLNLQISGVDVYDVTPAKLPNLYHGAPLRIYGRYRGQGDAQVTVNGTIQGQALQRTVDLFFPENDNENPEIERMWAMKRVNVLLKQRDKTENDQNLVDDIIRLGEGFSIVTPYTSFLVLENDAEYKRWKIDRRNRDRIQRDRRAQTRRREALQAMREKAARRIGPLAAADQAVNKQPPQVVNTVNPQPRTPADTPTPQASSPKRQSRNFSFGDGFSIGSGPVGPLFVGLSLLLARRKRKHTS